MQRFVGVESWLVCIRYIAHFVITFYIATLLGEHIATLRLHRENLTTFIWYDNGPKQTVFLILSIIRQRTIIWYNGVNNEEIVEHAS